MSRATNDRQEDHNLDHNLDHDAPDATATLDREAIDGEMPPAYDAPTDDPRHPRGGCRGPGDRAAARGAARRRGSHPRQPRRRQDVHQNGKRKASGRTH